MRPSSRRGEKVIYWHFRDRMVPKARLEGAVGEWLMVTWK